MRIIKNPNISPWRCLEGQIIDIETTTSLNRQKWFVFKKSILGYTYLPEYAVVVVPDNVGEII